VVTLADPRAASPMDTRLRLLLVFAGLPPEVQFTVQDRQGRMHFDLAYPEALLAVEYDGRGHEELGYGDRRRDLRSGALGWHTMRFDKAAVLQTPVETVALVRAQRERRLRLLSTAP
jgi:very-short-patch-repair endonuclease